MLNCNRKYTLFVKHLVRELNFIVSFTDSNIKLRNRKKENLDPHHREKKNSRRFV
jgi:hypothetical protein